MKLYHCTTQKKAKKYNNSKCIQSPVRGFDNLKAAMFWRMKTGRKVIYEFDAKNPHKLPDHHNQFGNAWWNDVNGNINDLKCVVSAHK